MSDPRRLAQLVVYHLARYTEAELVRTLRGERSQAQLADLAGISRNTIANVETGRQHLSVSQLLRLANAIIAGSSQP